MQNSISQAASALTRETANSNWLNVSRPLSSVDLQGRIVIAGFWASTSLSSIQALAELAALTQTLGPEICVLGVHSPKVDGERDIASVERALELNGITVPVVSDPELAIWRALGVHALGARVLIGPTGVGVAEFSAQEGLDELKAEIAELRERHEGELLSLPFPLRVSSGAHPGGSGLRFPSKLAWDGERKLLYIADFGNHRVVAVDLEGKLRFSIGGGGGGEEGRRDGSYEEARFRRPVGLHCTKDRLYIADSGNHLLRFVDLREKSVKTAAGTGVAGQERDPRGSAALKTALNGPWDLAELPTGEIAIALASAHQLWAYEPMKKTLRAIAGSSREALEDGESTASSLAQPSGLFPWDGKIFLVDSASSSLRKLEETRVDTLIGTFESGSFRAGLRDGTKAEALLQAPGGVYADPSGTYVADTFNHAIRRFDPFSERLETIAGGTGAGLSNGKLPEARFCEPTDVLRVGGLFLIADRGNHRVRILDPGKMTVTTLL